MTKFSVRLTMKSMYGESTWQREYSIDAEPLFADHKAKELASKIELRLTGSFITKIEVKKLRQNGTLQWTEVD